MVTESVLRAEGVVKHYGPVKALQGVSFDLRRGEVHALLGHNGAGKSTLVKTLTGSVQLDEGQIFLDGQAVSISSPSEAQSNGIAWVDQELTLIPNLSIEDNIALGGMESTFLAQRKQHRPRVKQLLEQIGLGHLSPTQEVGTLSIGERQLLEITRAFGRNSKIVILDEPTATLSDFEIERVFAAIREVTAEGVSVIYVSHRLEEIIQICDRATIMRDGQVVTTQEISGLDKSALVNLMVGQLPEFAEVQSTAKEGGNGDFSITNLSINNFVQDVTFGAKGGEIFGLAGQLGSGASLILRALAGLEPKSSGRVVLSGKQFRLGSTLRSRKAGVYFVSNDRKGEGLFLTFTNSRNLTATRLPILAKASIISRSVLKKSAETLMQLAGVDKSRRTMTVDSLSGGNQQKIFIGRNLNHPKMKLLLLDEPTRGVDVKGRAEIHQLIREASASGIGVIFSSTELDEIMELSDIIGVMHKGKLVNVEMRGQTNAAKVFNEMVRESEIEGVKA